MMKHKYSKEWQQAAEKEFKTLESKKAFVYTKHEEQKLLPLMWRFKYKFDSDGYLQKFKARLCARGDLQTTKSET